MKRGEDGMDFRERVGGESVEKSSTFYESEMGISEIVFETRTNGPKTS